MSGASASALPMWIGGLAVAGAVAVGAMFWANGRGAGPEPDPEPPVASPAVMAPATPPPADTRPAPAAETAEAPPAPQVEDPAPETQASLPLPRIDEFRFDPRGVAVLAGRAAPGDALVLRLDGSEITRADADAQGAFAAVALLDPSPDARVLTLAAVGPDGQERLSPDELIIAPVVAPVTSQEAPPAPEPAPVSGEDPVTGAVAASARDTAPEPVASPEPALVAAPEAEPRPAPEPQISAAESPAETAPAPTVTAAAPADVPAPKLETAGAAAPVLPETSEPAAPQETAVAAAPEVPAAPAQVAILRSGPDGVDVVQAPGDQTEPPRAVALDAISYSALGDVQLSGRAEIGASEVRIYLDNRPVAALPVATGGDWRGDVPDIQAGVYTLRIDAVDAAGAVQSRVETPFKREAPEVLEAAAAQSNLPVQAITVQRGATLWAIARERYGDPLLYVQVFEANRDQIRDPDLIYPGQVFTLPESGE